MIGLGKKFVEVNLLLMIFFMNNCKKCEIKNCEEVINGNKYICNKQGIQFYVGQYDRF